MATSQDFIAEAAEYSLAATVDRLGFVRVVDDCGRVLLIEAVEDGLLGDCWSLTVYRNVADETSGGVVPVIADELLDGTNVRVLFNHALCIAADVSTVSTCDDCERGYGPGAFCRCGGR